MIQELLQHILVSFTKSNGGRFVVLPIVEGAWHILARLAPLPKALVRYQKL